MGCDLYSRAERLTPSGWAEVELKPAAFDWRSYGLFAFFADVRNYSRISPIFPPRGLPDDACAELVDKARDWDYHGWTWLTLTELLGYDYERILEDRRHTIRDKNFWNGAATADAGSGQVMSYRDFLGQGYFGELERLRAAGVERLVLYFCD